MMYFYGGFSLLSFVFMIISSIIEIISYLQNGKDMFSVLGSLKWLIESEKYNHLLNNETQIWIYYPNSWFGLHHLMDKTPLFLFFMMFGIILAWLSNLTE